MRTFATITITLLSFSVFSQQKAAFIPRPAISFYFNGKPADAQRALSKSDTLIDVKAFLQGEQKKKMPDATFFITEVEVSLIHNNKNIAGIVLTEGKGSITPLAKLANLKDKYQITVRRIQFLNGDNLQDIGMSDVVKNYMIE